MKRKVNKSNNRKTADAKVKITEWWPSTIPEDSANRLAVVILEDGRYGLLKVNFDVPNILAQECYELDVVGKSDSTSKNAGQTHYTGRQIILPEDLRKHILKTSITGLMSNIADRLAEKRDEIPEFSAYVSAEGMKSGHCAAEEITQLADCLESLAFDQDETEESVIPNLRGLACECRKLWPHGMHEEQLQSGSGVC
jgi:hypothetical protein